MVVVNFSTPNYARGQQRLKQSLNGQKALMIDSYAAIGSPTHQESPYEFKLWAIKAASELDPVVLWADASMYRIGDISKIENIIISDGFYGDEAGHYLGRWCNEHTRNYFNLSERELIQGPGGITLFSAGLVGLDFNNPKSVDFFDQTMASAKAGCFRGSWLSHRHDMSCMSAIATRMGFKYQRGGSHLAYIGPGYSKPEPGVVFACQGMY